MISGSLRAFRLAYDGRPFRGFQRQPDVETVEDTVFDALRALDVLGPDADKPSGYAAAGRTDAGVSASAQAIAFAAPEWLTPAALNGELPGTIRAWASADVPRDFHATHDAASRTYTYYLHASDADPDRARASLSALSGEHDFQHLTPDDRGTVRDLETELERDEGFLIVTFRSDGFPRQLVRRLVSLVEAIAAGEAPLSKVDRVLGSEPLSGPEGVGPAPATGLVLADVAYPGVEFRIDEDAAASARAVFEQRRAAAATTARVAGAVFDGIGSESG